MDGNIYNTERHALIYSSLIGGLGTSDGNYCSSSWWLEACAQILDASSAVRPAARSKIAGSIMQAESLDSRFMITIAWLHGMT